MEADFDRIALLVPDTFDHNSFYHEFLLDQLPPHAGNALDAGCGKGQFSRLLAARANRAGDRNFREYDRGRPLAAGRFSEHRLPPSRCIAL